MITTLPQRYGKYLLLRKIALGGMAEIFRAKTLGAEGFEKTIVIKRILPHYTEDESFVKMFIDEASIASKLQHSNIVQIFDFDQQDDRYYIAMEYVEGRDLKNLISKARNSEAGLTVAQCVGICTEVAKGLHYAHTKEYNGEALNVVHRDVSPHNIMVSYAGEVKIMDFGIAKAAQRSTKTLAGQVKGKCAYMSPEQAKGKPLDGRSDLYALAIILWEILTGKRLFLGESDFETLSNVLKFDPPLVSSINPDVPPELDEIVAKGLAKDRDERYANMEEFGRALTKWLYATVDDLDQVNLKGPMESYFKMEVAALRDEYEHEREMAEKMGSASTHNVDSLPPGQSGSGPDPTATGAFQQSGGSVRGAGRWVGIAAGLMLAAGAAWMALQPGNFSDSGDSNVAGVAGSATSGSPALLTVNVEPSTAVVSANGRPVKGPIRSRVGDQVSLIAEEKGYERQVRTVKITARDQRVNLILEKSAPAPVTVVFRPSRSDARVFVDGKEIGAGEQRFDGVDGQEIQLEIRPASGGPPVSQRLTLREGMAPVDVQVGPLKATAKLFVMVTPRDTMISTDVGNLGRQGDAWEITALSVGDTVDLSATRPGYVSHNQKVVLKRANESLSIVMKRPMSATMGSTGGGGTGSMVINAKPWANVWVDGKKKGRTKIDVKSISSGSHKVKFEHPKFGVRTKVVTVRPGKKSIVFMDLTKK